MSSCHLTPSRKAVISAFALTVSATLALGQTWALADTGPTVRASLSGDGSVQEVSVLGGSGAPADKSSLPVTLKVTGQLDGAEIAADKVKDAKGALTTTFHVENTTAKDQEVSYLTSTGGTKTTTTNVQLPVVAQLNVTLPASYKDVSAPGAEVVTQPDGSHRLRWSMILFSPIGAPSADVNYSARVDKSGPTGVELTAQAVSPSGTPGLSGASQAANSTATGNGFLSAYANGANTGIDQLRNGVQQILTGLNQLSAGANKLHDGLAAGATGSKQLADGLHTAKAGSGKLSTGLGQLSTGNSALADGLPELTDGLRSLDGGLAQLGTELPDALDDGLAQIKGAISAFAIGEYIGSAGKEGTLLYGVSQLSGGLDHPAGALGASDPGGVKQVLSRVLDGLDHAPGAGGSSDPGGAKQNLTSLQQLLGCDPNPAPSPCAFVSNPAVVNGVPAPILVQQILVGLKAGLGDRGTAGNTALYALTAVVAGIGTPTTDDTLLGGLNAVKLGLDHPSKIVNGQLVDPGGLKQFLSEQINGGLDLVSDGVRQGLQEALGNANSDPETTLRGGANALAAGSADAAAGAAKLAAGAKAADKGGKELNAGIGKISAGQDKVAAGLPAAVTGAGQIADGLGKVVPGQQKVDEGLGKVKTDAVQNIATSLSEGSDNARLQLAVINAADERVSSTPGVAGTTYLLTAGDLQLAANSSSTESHTLRNAGVAGGGLLALLAGLGAGFGIGRRRSTV
jgi:putative membrane protein